MSEEQRAFTSASFYQYLKEHKLMGVRCKSCAHLSSTPRPLCPRCHGTNVAWTALSGKGKLSTFTVISVVPVLMAKKGYGRTKPYCSGIVTLEEGPRISGLILGVDATKPHSIRPGLPVQIDFSEVDSERPGLVFRATSSAS